MEEDKTTKILVRVIATISIAITSVVLFLTFLLRVKSDDETLFTQENILQGAGLFALVLIGGYFLTISSSKSDKGNDKDG